MHAITSTQSENNNTFLITRILNETLESSPQKYIPKTNTSIQNTQTQNSNTNISTQMPIIKRGHDISEMNTSEITTITSPKRKRKKRMVWCERDMKRALRMVEQGGMSGRSAAEICHVPSSTLWVRLKQRKHDREDKEEVNVESESESEWPY
jgi:hypothetical protein